MFAFLKAPVHLSYVARIASELENNRPEGEELELLVTNAWNEISSETLRLIAYKESSNSMETLIWYSNTKNINDILALMSEDADTTVQFLSVPFSCYVFDVILWRLKELYPENAEDVFEVFKSMFGMFSGLSREDLIKLATNKNSTFVLRHFIQTAVGVNPENTPNNLNYIFPIKDINFQSLGKKFIKNFVRKVSQSSNEPQSDNNQDREIESLRDLSFSPTASPLVQIMIDAAVHLELDELLDEIIQSVTEENYNKDNPLEVKNVLQLVCQKSASHVMERVVEALSVRRPEDMLQLYNNYFSGNMVRLVKNPVGNYVLQRLIENFPSNGENEFHDVVKEMADSLDSMTYLMDNRLGVVLALFLGASKLHHIDSQRILLRSLVSVLEKQKGISNNEVRKSFALLLITLKNQSEQSNGWPKGKSKKKSYEKYSSLGCQLLAALFNFEQRFSAEPIGSYVRLEPQTLKDLSCSKEGSRLMDDFDNSSFVSDLHKRDLIMKFFGHFGELALDKFGSFCVKRCYTMSNLMNKEKILKELVVVADKLSETEHGYHVAKHCRLALYSYNKENWLLVEQKQKKKAAEFADLTSDGKDKKDSNSKKRKRNEDDSSPNKRNRNNEKPQEPDKENDGKETIQKKRKRNDFEKDTPKKRNNVENDDTPKKKNNVEKDDTPKKRNDVEKDDTPKKRNNVEKDANPKRKKGNDKASEPEENDSAPLFWEDRSKSDIIEQEIENEAKVKTSNQRATRSIQTKNNRSPSLPPTNANIIASLGFNSKGKLQSDEDPLFNQVEEKKRINSKTKQTKQKTK